MADNEDRSARERAEMRAIAAGDSAAFRRLVDREAPRLLRFAQGMLGSLDEAEDVVQDTLIRLWENAARWTPDARIGTWLHRVCYNRAIDRLRRRRAFVDESALEEFADESEPADAALVRSESGALGPRGDRAAAGAAAHGDPALPRPGPVAARRGGGDGRQRGGVRVDARARAAAIAPLAFRGGRR